MAGSNRGIPRALIINEQVMIDIQSIPKAPLGSVNSGSLLLNLHSLFFFIGFVFFFFFKGSHNQPKKVFFLGDGQKLKDWHDKEAIRRDSQRVGTESGVTHGRGPWRVYACVCVRARVRVCMCVCVSLGVWTFC